MIRLISWIITALTHTVHPVNTTALPTMFVPPLTLFADQGIIAVVGVVCISDACAATIA